LVNSIEGTVALLWQSLLF